MQTIVVVNGSVDWRPWFPGYKVQQVYLQSSRWMFQDGQLWILDQSGAHRPDGILWRLGAVTPAPMHRACLEMIRLAGVPCVNPPDALLRGYDRLSMLAELRRAGLPLIDFEVFTGVDALLAFSPRLPAVLKLDNHHGGQAKALAQTRAQWDDLVSLASVYMGYATVEPFIAYQRDLRCLLVGQRVWAMQRSSAGWKANVATDSYQLVEPPAALSGWTRQAAQHLQADTLGLDFLEAEGGGFVLLESNDVPGVLGFPDEVPSAMARLLIDRVVQRRHPPTA